MLFVEFMSEMKRPFDFWKGMICAQTFIYFCYMLFGIFVYSYQGQFTLVRIFHIQISSSGPNLEPREVSWSFL